MDQGLSYEKFEILDVYLAFILIIFNNEIIHLEDANFFL